MTRVLLALAALFTLVAWNRTSEPAEQGVRRALLIGCGDYPLLQRADPVAYATSIALAGPANDVALLRDVLVEELDFDAANVRTLVGWPDDESLRPTRERILLELAALRDASGPGDFVFVHFSGHGSQQPSRERDSAGEPDGLDEVLLPADVAAFDPAKGTIAGALRDDEIGAALAAIRDRGATVWFVVDACHSGSLLRGDDDVRWRGIDPDVLGVPRTTRRSTKAVAASAQVALDRIALFHGAQSHGRAPEYTFDDGGVERTHGLFTWLLAKELVRTRGAVTYRELIARVVAAYQAWPCRVTVPGASGDDLDRSVLGDAQGERALLAVREGEAWRIDAGRLAGLVDGARLELLGDDGAVAGVVRVTSAGPFESRATVVGDALVGAATALRARVVEVPLADPSLCFALVDGAGVALADDVLPTRVRDELLAPERVARYPLVAPDAADWWLVLDGGRARLRPRAATGGADLLLRDVADAPRELARIARAQNLVRLAATSRAALPSGLTLTVEVRDHAKAAPRTLVNGERLAPGCEVRVRCSKPAGAPVDLNLFYVDALHGLTRLFPRTGDSPRLAADTSGVLTVLDWTPLLDTSLGCEHVLAIAQQRDEGDAALDLAALEQAGVSTTRSATQDAVAQFLEDLASAQPTRAGIGSVAGGGDVGFALATLDVGWRGSGAPTWPAASRVASLVERLPHGFDVPETVALPSGPWTEAAFVTTADGPKADPSVLLLGDEHAPRLALIDVDLRTPRAEGTAPLGVLEALDSARFVPDLLVAFDDRGAVAIYRAPSGGVTTCVLVDRDGDGIAEARHARHGGAWTSATDVALPWLSQSWFGSLPSARARTAAMRALAALDSLRE
jgi:hypothetical protein